MLPKISVFIATSLDGFIARKNDSLDWLDQANASAPPGEDCGYRAFMASVDVLVMGKYTFEKVLTFGEWPYGDQQVIVMSSKKLDLPVHLTKTVSTSSESPRDLAQRLATQGAKHLYVDGGVTIQRFLQAGLIDEMTITFVPVILGEGKSLFGPIGRDIALTHLNTHAYDFGYVQMKYGVQKSSPKSN
jgi:dihydrofolate reductase